MKVIFLVQTFVACALALPCFGQTGKYLFTGSEVLIHLNPGAYDIAAYGAQGGANMNVLGNYWGGVGGLGAEMEGLFNFTTPTTLLLLVGGAGNDGQGAGGGGGSFVWNGSVALVVGGGGGGGGIGSTGSPGSVDFPGSGNGGPSDLMGGGGGGYYSDGDPSPYSGSGGSGGGKGFLHGGAGGLGGWGSGGSGGFGGGGGGGGDADSSKSGGGGGGYSGGVGATYGYGGHGGTSIIDPSALADITEASGIASPDGSHNGWIIISEVPEPGCLTLLVLGLVTVLGIQRLPIRSKPV